MPLLFVPEVMLMTEANSGLELAIHFWKQTSRYSLLQRLQRIGQRIFFRFAEQDGWPIQAVFWLEWGSSIAGRTLLRFAEQEMNMLGHDYVPVSLKSEPAPHPLQG